VTRNFKARGTVQVQVIETAAERLGDGLPQRISGARHGQRIFAATRARRRRTVTARRVIPSIPVAAARSVPARPLRVSAASVASSDVRSRSRVTRRGLSSARG